MVQGACFIEPMDSEALQEQKERRLRYSDYYAALQDLTPNEFELLCGKLIGLFGVKNPCVTRTSADEGIDFYGHLSLNSLFFPNDLSPTLQKQLKVWLVGQAKHYKKTQSGTPQLRELVGSVELGRARAFGSVSNPLSGLDLRVADPVFMIFVTTGSISINGWRLLERSGVIGFDGEMIAAFLADRGAGMNENEFDANKFKAWLLS
jgi:hypothetical protein